ncbi:MAG: ABC transporter permease [Microbacterium sp.]
MIRFVVVRLLQAIPLMIAATMVIFTAVALAGDPLDRYRVPNVLQSTLAAKAHELGLDLPLWQRYWNWITNALHGDLGMNASGRPVLQELMERGAVSLRLVGLAIVLAIILAIVVGYFSAVHNGRVLDKVLIALTIVLLTAPEFWVAVIAKESAIGANRAFGMSIPTVGDSTPGASGGAFAQWLDRLPYLVLPTIVLVLAAYPVWALYQRSAMIEVLDSDYLRFARAKGLGETRVLVAHGLRTSLIPVVTMIALRIPWIISGVVVVEMIFGWRGLGRMLVDGIQKQDVNTVLAFLLLFAVLITVLNLAADLLYRFLDPRVRDV